MREFLPILIVGAIIGVFTVIFLVAYALEMLTYSLKLLFKNIARCWRKWKYIIWYHNINT